jgi:nicotinamide-nucleotide amidase
MTVADSTSGHAGGGGDPDDRRVAEIVRLVGALDATIAVAESLTAGSLSVRLGRGESASSWYRGAVVAYDEEVKFDVLGVTRGPVVTDTCAREMAIGVRRLLHADVGLGITGVGGPGPEEGRPPGTVHVAVSDHRGVWSREHRFSGDPEDILAAATSVSLDALAETLREGSTEASS